jgi:hypothetical protein
MTAKPRRVALYLRVSTDGQSTGLQCRDLVPTTPARWCAALGLVKVAAKIGHRLARVRPQLGLEPDACHRRIGLAGGSVTVMTPASGDVLGLVK